MKRCDVCGRELAEQEYKRMISFKDMLFLEGGSSNFYIYLDKCSQKWGESDNCPYCIFQKL